MASDEVDVKGREKEREKRGWGKRNLRNTRDKTKMEKKRGERLNKEGEQDRRSNISGYREKKRNKKEMSPK